MPKTYLAIDLGAESGRAILGRYENAELSMEEIHRFPNEPVEYGGSLHWDVPRLWFEIQRALDKAKNTKLDGIAVDTWGVDYALLGVNGQLLENPYHYRDKRTHGMMESVFRSIPAERIYETTGIQFMPINTLYQLAAAKQKTPRLLDAAEQFLTIPDLFHYWLSGTAACEFTNATTTQLVDARTRQWATPLFESLGIRPDLPAHIVEPGTILGSLQSNTEVPVIAPASHDTGSAVAAITARGTTAFLSSGTWSLVGIELDAPVINAAARRMNFTNEGGVCGTTRLLKNVMGLWILQGCRKRWSTLGTDFEYNDLIRMAMNEPPFRHLVDPDDGRFLKPDCMLAAVDSFCRETGQAIPATPGAYVRSILESLALKYRIVLRNIEQLTGTKLTALRKIGGGSRNHLLNQFAADATGLRVLAGPVEATALGNIAIQMLATGATSSLEESRAVVDRSYQTILFEPRDTAAWDKQLETFEQYCEMNYV